MLLRLTANRQQSLEDFGRIFQPAEALEPILAKPVRAALHEWRTEIFAADELAKVELQPRRRAIFDGPPGGGKTTLAHHLSARLGLPMLQVGSESIVDTWVGSSARNMAELFDLLEKQHEAATKDPESFSHIVLFLDEFDSLAAKREGSRNDERKSMTNTLLQRVERYGGFVIAATNFAGEIDQAVWRRFDIHIKLELPGQFERERILERYLSPFGLPEDALRALAEACETAAPSLMRQLCESLKRNIVIGPKVGWDMRREAIFERIVASVRPHESLGKPRLWSEGAEDRSLRTIPWPLPLAKDLPKLKKAKKPKPEDDGKVIHLRGNR